mgnify:CR=1 FL=1
MELIKSVFPLKGVVDSRIGGRSENQDGYGFRDTSIGTVIVVCDGMGGLNSGELASISAINYIKDRVVSCADDSGLSNSLCRIIIEANRFIRELKDEDGNPLRAGTTMVMTVIRGSYLNWISVGDSKIYLLRENEIVSLTNEHNYSFLVEKHKDDDGFIFNPSTRPDALVSYLGAPTLQYIDLNAEPLKLINNDVLILCSDGLYKNLNEEQIKVLFLSEKQDMQRFAEMLTTAATIDAAGMSQDNTTVVVLKYLESMF